MNYKGKLYELIKEIPNIRKCFHSEQVSGIRPGSIPGMKHKESVSFVDVISDSQIYQKWKNDVTIVIESIKVNQPTLKLTIDEIETGFRSIELDFMTGGRSAFDNIETSIKSLYEYVDDSYIGDAHITINLADEFLAACIKIADNPVDYSSFDEDGLNREIRNLLKSSIIHFGYDVNDQTQAGYSGNNPGENDNRIYKHNIPIAIYEGLIHRDKRYLYEHIDKAIGKYNCVGCQSIYVVEYFKNKNFTCLWNTAVNNVKSNAKLKDCAECDTGCMGVKLLKGSYMWEQQFGNFYYIGVKCTQISNKKNEGS